MPTKDTRLAVKDKLPIVLEAERDTIKGTTRRNQVAPYQVRIWKKMKIELEAAVKRNPRARSLDRGRPCAAPQLEENLASWILECRSAEIAVSSTQVIAKALSMDRNFRGGKRSAM
ncbi:putative pogo transposable element with krab domain [Phytophthora infestans]|uniref:Putative pogo transposable element with krab domain n=1 Tax=Phytophthora infestans TaxID=4787 RepID=A0A8S9TXZ6_PHYIN|nr:putative pogo transposable element with krab domain [Phytophthora infestans]